MEIEIAHWDGDAFFASIEQAADRRLRGLPVAVGGGPGGVIACASYEARGFGLHAGMPTREALRRCPELRLLRGHFELYEQFSGAIFDLCRDLSPQVEESGLDEGFIGLMGWAGGGGRRPNPVESLRKLNIEVRGWLKISISQGLAANRRVAAIASKLRKPNGFVVVPHGAEADFLEPLPVTRLPGIGPKSAATLSSLGVIQVGQLRQFGLPALRTLFGTRAEAWMQLARGEDPRPLASAAPRPAQSLSRQITFDEDTGDEAFVRREALQALEDLLRSLRQSKRLARTLTLGITYSDYDENAVSRSLDAPANCPEPFMPLLGPLLRSLWKRRVLLRRIRLRLANFYPAHFQGDLFQEARTVRPDKLHQALDSLHQTHGPDAVRRASCLGV
jgi:DNA polymerase IV